MRYSDDKIHELKEKVRFEMVKNPNVTILELQAILGDNYHHNFDKNFVGKLKRKVHKERVLRLNFASLNEDVAAFEDLVSYGRQQLMDTVFSDENKYETRKIIGGFRAIVWAESMLIEMKLNCGIYQREDKDKPLTPEQKESIDRALSMLQYAGTCAKCEK